MKYNSNVRNSCLPIFACHAAFFRPETIVASFLHGDTLQRDIQRSAVPSGTHFPRWTGCHSYVYFVVKRRNLILRQKLQDFIPVGFLFSFLSLYFYVFYKIHLGWGFYLSILKKSYCLRCH